MVYLQKRMHHDDLKIKLETAWHDVHNQSMSKNKNVWQHHVLSCRVENPYSFDKGLLFDSSKLVNVIEPSQLLSPTNLFLKLKTKWWHNQLIKLVLFLPWVTKLIKRKQSSMQNLHHYFELYWSLHARLNLSIFVNILFSWLNQWSP